jgi:hypothetical protein
MAVVFSAVFMRRRLVWAGALLVMALAAAPLPPSVVPEVSGPATGDVIASLQLPGGQLPDKLPVAAMAPGEAGLEALRAPGQRPRPTPPADPTAFQRRLKEVFHAAATETGVRHAQRRLQAYPLDPPLRLLNPGNAPPRA